MASVMAFKNRDPTNEDMSYLESQYNRYVDDISWTYSIFIIVYSLTMPIGGKLETKYGPKLVILFGATLILSGLISTYFVFAFSSIPYLLYLSYGVALGGGAGIMFTTPYIVGMRWFEHHHRKGFVAGLIFSGFSWSSVMFNLLSTAFINPTNIPIDQRIGFIQEQSGVLDNVPSCFLKLAALCLFLYILGIMLIANPSEYRTGPEMETAGEVEFNEFTPSARSTPSTSTSDKSSLLSTFNAKQIDGTLSIKEVVAEGAFWILFFSMLLLPVTYVYSQWRVFNVSYLGIEDDRVLSVMGSTSSVIEGVSRLVTGWLFDWLQMRGQGAYKVIMGTIAGIATIFIATWTQLVHIEDDTIKLVFAFLWLMVLFAVTRGALTIVPIHTAHLYGTKQGGVVYGLLYLARIGGTLFSTLAIVETRQLLGWLYMNYFWVATQCILFVLTMYAQ